jgi:peptidoglycan/LPS O-acetylase OafA/YrhL
MQLMPSRIAHALRPNFHNALFARAPAKLRPTAWLDGLRGVAAFMVVVHHWADCSHPTASHGYGNIEDPFVDREWIKLPILRLLFNSGHANVAMFFLISGFVLSYKPIELIHKRKFDALHANLSSTLLRRPARLCLPAFVVTFFVCLIVRLPIHNSNGLFTYYIPPKPTLFAQLWDWFSDLPTLPDAFTWDMIVWLKYHAHSWTLNVELHGSLWAILVLLATSRLNVAPRMILISLWCIYCLSQIKYFPFLFCAGILLAEATHIMGPPRDFQEQQSKDLETSALGFDREDQLSWHDIGPLETITYYFNLLVGLFLVSAPNHSPQNKAFWWSDIWIRLPIFTGLENTDRDKQRTLISIGAFLIVSSIFRLRNIQRLFENGFAQYLGRLSFSIYLIHGPFLYTIGQSFIVAVWTVFGVGNFSEGLFRDERTAHWAVYEISTFLGLLIQLPFILWLSDIFERLVDEPCMRLTKQWADHFTIKDEQERR